MFVISVLSFGQRTASEILLLVLEQEAVVVVIQLIGRLCVMVALASLSLYSIELYPTKVR